MKQILCGMLVVLLLVSILIIPVNASEMEIQYLDDGCYITIQIDRYASRASNSVTGTKTYTHYSSDGISNWKAVLTGTFTYTGSTSTCTTASVSTTVYDSSWSVYNKTSSKSGNTASAYVEMIKKSLGVTIMKVPASLSLSCDANGNLS